MLRRVFVWLHRWTGLLMAAFLIIEGLTGSLIAFYGDLDRLISPQLFANPPSPNAVRLSLGALAERAEKLVPHGHVQFVSIGAAGRAGATIDPRQDPATGEPYDLGFNQLYLNPWTGEEITRFNSYAFTRGWASVMPFIYKLHEDLALGMPGVWVLLVVALAWTIDCFVGFYLTLPVAIEDFLHRWKPAWLVKRRAGFFRLNFDLHRASGLWLWPLLFIFAWSSVMLTSLPAFPISDWVMYGLFGFAPQGEESMPMPPHPNETPRLDWRAAEAIGARLMAEQALSHGFVVEQPLALGYEPSLGQYLYSVLSNRDLMKDRPMTSVLFDGDTGAFQSLALTKWEHSGDTVSNWLIALHLADLHGSLAYRIFVFVLGLAITGLSVTGVYIWWKKRRARKFSKAHRGVVTQAEDAAAA
jgi:uncharacterized iron-regulated membrane protein